VLRHLTHFRVSTEDSCGRPSQKALERVSGDENPKMEGISNTKRGQAKPFLSATTMNIAKGMESRPDQRSWCKHALCVRGRRAHRARSQM
jgi:hypothetical protein